MSKPVVSATEVDKTTTPENALHWSKYSELSKENQEAECLNACRALTDSIYEGLDLKQE
jgi:hypothetical protein